MKTKDGVVYFKSASEMFVREKSGKKNNTVRLLSEAEHNMVLWTKINEIEMTDSENGEIIRRTVTDITQVGGIEGFRLVVFSWISEGLANE